MAIILGDHAEHARDLSQSLSIAVRTLHEFESPVAAIEQAALILVSGDTWLLNQMLYEPGLIVAIQRAVRERDVPYVGWSAGCNVATPSIRTTNDMPVRSGVILPALGLVPRYKSIRTILMRTSAAIWAKPAMNAYGVLRR